MKPNPNLPSKHLSKIINSNQNTHRLASLAELHTLHDHAITWIRGLLSSPKERAHHAAGVLLWALMSKKSPIVVVSCDDLDKRIAEAEEHIPEGKFCIRSPRGKSTIWAQLTGFLVKEGFIKILKPQAGRAPAVVEVIHEEWLQFIGTPVTDELRLNVINSTCKHKYSSLQDFEASIPQDDNSTEATRPQDHDTTRLQYYDTTRHSEQQSVQKDVQQNHLFNENFWKVEK